MQNYTIKNSYLTLTVCERGASIIDLSTAASSFPVLRPVSQGDAFNAGESALFPLVPFANRIRNNAFEWQGEQIKLPHHALDSDFFLHGDGWVSDWSLREQSQTHLLFELTSQIEHVCRYRATLGYWLEEGCLVSQLSVQNEGEQAFPFGLGLHPFFTVIEGTQLQFSASGMWLEDESYLPTEHLESVPADFCFHTLREVPARWINNGFTGWSGCARLIHPNGIRVMMTSDCPVLQVFQPENHDLSVQRFICLEPQTHAVDDHNRAVKGLLQLLQSGQKMQMKMEIHVATA